MMIARRGKVRKAMMRRRVMGRRRRMLRALVAERALLMAEVVHQTSGSEPQRVARRRLN